MMRYRMAVASRPVVTASAAAACLAVWLPMARADAVTTAQMLSFVVYACGVIWVFATRNAWRAWGGIVLPAAVFGGLFLAGRALGVA